MRISSSILILLLLAGDLWSAEQSRPNILWLSCEDLSPRLGCYGDDTVPTPNIDRLAHEGIRYTHAFTATGVCAPCRHTMITGLYPMQSGAQYMRTTSRSSALGEVKDPSLRTEAKNRRLYEATPPAGVRCFTEYLRMAGYYCTNNSKEDYQFVAPVTAWDESSPKAHYRNRASGQPFFAVFNNTVTHESGIHGARRSLAKTDPTKVAVPKFLPDTPVVRSDIARYYDNIIELDAWVGKKLAELKKAGLADSTIVFFFSDHGDGLPRHKRWVYDSGTHVPMIVRFPDGFKAGTTDDRLMSFIDLAPTVMDLAGLDQPAYMSGGVFTGPNASPSPEYVFMHRDRMDDTSHETIRAARDKQFQYVRNYRADLPYLQPLPYRDRAATMSEIYRLIDNNELNEDQWQWTAKTKPLEELYDTDVDPDEIHNLASDPRYFSQLAKMREALEQWEKNIDDPLATPEMEVLKNRVWPPNGKQSTTAQPEISIFQSVQGPFQVTIDCPTEGASVGYRESGSGPWTIYTAPFETDAKAIEVVAHRIGWKSSTIKKTLAGESE
ncbi:sulfatase family protein [Bythopirellula polymerisocia]|uniref:Arylsulfatase n=1 Tax=Bythopirellula polymerisocia TaxID=2528003 RepID=A0A5C6CDF0_9BACT|nr:sulfatase [Bythopirellula polymerisocia]TWU22600.1 Arylsulfatase [Bythopirellula polymerisocia]